jgi:hypothetical protein
MLRNANKKGPYFRGFQYVWVHFSGQEGVVGHEDSYDKKRSDINGFLGSAVLADRDLEIRALIAEHLPRYRYRSLGGASL